MATQIKAGLDRAVQRIREFRYALEKRGVSRAIAEQTEARMLNDLEQARAKFQVAPFRSPAGPGLSQR